MTELNLEGRPAVVTGAASGIGRALAMEAAARGMQVAIADINAEGLAETERALAERQVRVVAQVLGVREVEAFGAACFGRVESIATVWANAGINLRSHPKLASRMAKKRGTLAG